MNTYLKRTMLFVRLTKHTGEDIAETGKQSHAENDYSRPGFCVPGYPVDRIRIGRCLNEQDGSRTAVVDDLIRRRSKTVCTIDDDTEAIQFSEGSRIREIELYTPGSRLARGADHVDSGHGF